MAKTQSEGGGYLRGSQVITIHTDRKMKSYQVLDSELKHISTFNGWATLFYSLASASASMFVGLWCNLFVADTPSEFAKRYGSTFEYVFGALCVVFLLLAGASTLSRRSELHRIKSESGDGSQSWFSSILPRRQ